MIFICIERSCCPLSKMVKQNIVRHLVLEILIDISVSFFYTDFTYVRSNFLSKAKLGTVPKSLSLILTAITEQLSEQYFLAATLSLILPAIFIIEELSRKNFGLALQTKMFNIFYRQTERRTKKNQANLGTLRSIFLKI